MAIEDMILSMKPLDGHVKSILPVPQCIVGDVFVINQFLKYYEKLSEQDAPIDVLKNF